MALKLQYYGQNDSQWSPDIALTGDPGTDQQTLTAAGYLGGRIMALAVPKANTAVEAVLIPSDPAGNTNTLFTSTAGVVPFGTLINGPGEFAGAIGPSGSKKVPVVRAFWQGNVNSEAYAPSPSTAYATAGVGAYLYCGTSAYAGFYTTDQTASKAPVGIMTHVPTTAEPWLGVASLL
jgi:hypothetical protein